MAGLIVFVQAKITQLTRDVPARMTAQKKYRRFPLAIENLEYRRVVRLKKGRIIV